MAHNVRALIHASLRGFTFAEILIVVSLIGLFTGVGVTTIKPQIDKGNDAKRKSDLYKFKNVFEEYYNDIGCYPTNTQWNNATCGSATSFLSPYLETFYCDPTTKIKYVYQTTDKSGNACDGTCGKCSGYRLLAHLANTSDADIGRAGCDAVSCGISVSGGPNPNWGLAMGAQVPVPGFLPGQGQNTGHTDAHDCQHTKDPGCDITPTPSTAPGICKNYVFERSIGTVGNGPGQFNKPEGISVDANGNLYVADTNNFRVQVLSPQGSYVRSWGSYGTGNGEFKGPQDVAIDSHGNVYVADWGTDRIQKFTPEGTHLLTWGSHGTANGQFRTPDNIAFDHQGNVFVSDSGNYRIQKFTPEGIYLNTIGSYGYSDGHFITPLSVAIDSLDTVYSVDSARIRIQTFSADGVFQKAWGSYVHVEWQPNADYIGKFWLLYDIFVDTRGTQYIVDVGNDYVQIFDKLDNFITLVGNDGTNNPGHMDNPTSIAVLSDNTLYITQKNPSKILQYRCAEQ